MAEDDDMALLKRRKLLEMQRRLLKEKTLAEENAKMKEQNEKKPKTSEEIVLELFIGRALEVWTAAKQQYPQVAQEIAKALAPLIECGKLKERITGEQLFWLFQQLRLPIRLKTTIRIYEGGELKTIADKLKEK